MFDTFGNFLLLVLGFAFVIFVHELGHFAVAKWVGIKVEQFAIGFGPAIGAWRKGIGWRAGSTQKDYAAALKAGRPESELGETEYRINWLPLGGYVKMLGQEDLDMAHAVTDPRSYSAKPVWARMAVVSAGVIMNLIFAVIFFVIAFLWGVQFQPAVVGDVAKDSNAAQTRPLNADEAGIAISGIQPGDRILAINGKETHHFKDVRMAAAIARPGRPLAVDVERDGKTLRFAIEPQPDSVTGLLDLGISPALSNRFMPAEVLSDEDFAASLARARIAPDSGITRDMALVAANGRPVEAAWDLHEAINAAGGDRVELVFEEQPVDKRGRPVPLPDGRTARSVNVSLDPAPDLMFGRVLHGEEQYAAPHLLGLTPPVQIALVNSTTARDAGLRAGDVIQRLQMYMWPRIDQLFPLIQAERGKSAEFQVLRSDGSRATIEAPVSRKGQVGIAPELALSLNHVAAPITWPDGAVREDVDADEVLANLQAQWLNRVESQVPMPDAPGADGAGSRPGSNLGDRGGSATGSGSAPAGMEAPIPAAAAALQLLPGTQVLSVNGQSVSNWGDLLLALQSATAEAARGDAARPNRALPATVQLRLALPLPDAEPVDVDWFIPGEQVSELHALGFNAAPLEYLFMPAQITMQASDPIEAIQLGIDETTRVLLMTYLTIDRLFRGSVKVEHLKGPVGIAELGTKVAGEGLPYLILFLAIISVNLAVINFLPIPIVDGGLFLFLVIEKIKGSPVSDRVQNVATVIGLLLIGGLFMVTFYNDVMNLVGNLF